MSLVLYNSLSKRKEVFKSIENKRVRMYSCGPTVYNTPHIGNYRSFLFSDLLHRFLRASGYDVVLVMNITDIDNKTIAGATASGQSLRDFTHHYEKEFLTDLETLHFLPAEKYPRASEHIPEMVTMIETLITKGHAYREADSTYFRLASFPEYGKLSGIDPDEQRSGASERISTDEYSRDTISDFALWKAFKAHEDGDVFYDTSLGKGRPGWHIECSAMSQKYLGEHFDIHTGGIDNKFPHHENELAQSVCATGSSFVNYWLHASHLMIESEKMSKSLGNVHTLRDLLDQGAPPMSLRYMLLSTHYRNTYNFTFANVHAATKALARLGRIVGSLTALTKSSVPEENFIPRDHPTLTLISAKKVAFTTYLNDDLNTSGALGELFELTHALTRAIENRLVSISVAKTALAFYQYADTILGFGLDRVQLSGEETLPTENIPQHIHDLLTKRNKLRAQKAFEDADKVRQRLTTLGYQIVDTPEKTILQKIVSYAEKKS